MNRKASVILGVLIILFGGYILVYRGGWVKTGENGFMAKNQQEKSAVTILNEIPSSLPQDLLPEPVTPSLIQSTVLPKGGEEIKIEYISLNALDNVSKFYQQVLAAKGWSVEVVSEDARQVRLKVSKEGKVANFSLIRTETSGTQVSVVYNILTK